MNEFISSLLKDMAGLAVGWKILILIIILIIQLAIFLSRKYIVSWFMKVINSINSCNNSGSHNSKFNRKGKKSGVIITKSDLLNNPLFFTMSHTINHRVKMMQYGDEKRNKLFRGMLEIMLNNICSSCKEMISLNLHELSAVDFRTRIYNEFSNILYKNNHDIKERFGDIIFKLVMQNPERGFNIWHEPVSIFTNNLILDICESNIYHNNYERLDAILNVYHSMIDATLINIEKTFKSYNGELDEAFKSNNI